MGWFMLTGLMVLVAVLCFIVAWRMPSLRAWLYMGSIGVVLVWLVITTALCVHQIGAGHVGVVYQFGDIVGQRSAGLQLVFPWQGIRVESIQVQRYKFENLAAFSQETQDIFSSVTLNYSVSPEAIQALYRDVGPDWFTRLIEPRVHNYFKEATVRYKSVEMAPNRENLRLIVKDKLTEDLAQFSITVHDFLIDNVDFRPEFKQAIEAKMIATQDALREQERVAQIRNVAQQKIEEAKGEAESIKIKAQGQADANRLLAESLTAEVIQFAAVQKLGDKIQVVILPSGQGIIIDPSTFLKAQ